MKTELAGGGVYLIRCRPTGDLYVGSAAWIAWRLQLHSDHLRCGRHINSRLRDVVDAHGLDSLEAGVAEVVPDEGSLLWREAAWVAKLNPSLNIALLTPPEESVDAEFRYELPEMRPLADLLNEEGAVSINVILPASERRAFDRWCRFGLDSKISMTRRIRELIAADAVGEVALPRTDPPARGKPQVKGPRGSPPAPRRGK